jgi:molybdopterin adenylyltransferase
MAFGAGQAFQAINIAVLTVSDTRTSADDRSGDVLVERIVNAGHFVAVRATVRDEIGLIEAMVRQWISDDTIDVIVSTGGTGVSGRDVTPEAFARIIQKELPGFGELFRMLSYSKIGTSCMLSRAVAGVADGTYLFALPGSPSAVADAWDGILQHQFDSRTQPGNLVKLLPRLGER